MSIHGEVPMETTKTSREAPWVGAVKQLCSYFEENDAKIDLLRDIDRAIVDASMSLDEFLSSPLNDLARLTRANESHFYVDSGKEMLLLHTIGPHGMPKSFALSSLSSMLPDDSSEPILVSKENFALMGEYFPISESLLVIPVWPTDRTLSSAANRFGVVMLGTQRPGETSPFYDQTVQSFAQAAIAQLALGIRFRLENRRLEWVNKLTDEFFKLDLEPSRCFKLLAQKVPDFLPSFGPFRMKTVPEVQILIAKKKKQYLTIVGTTEQETGTKIKVSESVVGLLLQEPHPPYILGNPRTDPVLKKLYKAYLGKEEGKKINAELAVPIESDGERIAVVNLESEWANAFTQIHIDAVQDLCNILAPIVTALHTSVVKMETRQEAVLDAQRSYWDSVGALLSHNTNGPLVSIRLSVDNAMKAVPPDQAEKVGQILSSVYDSVAAVAQEIDRFCMDLCTLTVYGRYSVRDLIKKALGKLTRRLASDPYRVEAQLSQGEDFEIFCSPALELHLYNMLDNSLQSVRKRMAKEPGHQGRISVTVEPGPMPAEDQEIELNRTCRVVIEDNGIGCPEETLDRLFRQPVESSRTGEEGMGHALYAAGNYLQTMGGSAYPESEVGKWFRVTLTLPIFDPRIHDVTGLGDE
jgi:signal transduction histidine kinase